MSHELTIRTNGTAEMAFTGENAWHGLGQRLEANASLETWQAAAGMDWRIKRSKVRYFADANGSQQLEMPDQHVLFRSDTKAPLGIVSPAYQTVQPTQVLEFFRDLVDNAGYQLSTAGTLFGGKKFWALANVANDTIAGQDKVGGYLLLSTSCDGSMATECRETTIRVVCNNTLSMARSAKNGGVIRVGHRTKFNADSMKAQMQDSALHFATFMEQARKLSAKRVTNAMAAEFVRNLLRPLEAGELTQDDEKRAPKGEGEILALFRGNAMGGTLFGTAGTAWGLVNAVTEYIDHRSSAKSDSHRLDRAFFGSGDALKSTAFDLAMSL